MHEAEHDVAILHGVDEDANGDEVVDLIEVFVLVDHLAVDAVEMFWSAGDLVFEVDGVHFPAQIADDFVDVFQAFLALHGNALNEVKARAAVICRSVEEDGVYHYCLENHLI